MYELSIALERLPSGTERQAVAGRSRAAAPADRSGGRPEASGDSRRSLYAPERASARLGRVTINAFESAPEKRLGALQSLLVLGLIGRFGRHRTAGSSAAGGAALHDQFMLPDVLFDDLRAVVAEPCGLSTTPFQLDWFEPLFDLRFPSSARCRWGQLTARAARRSRTVVRCWRRKRLPAAWHASVDASNERLQVTLSGAHPGRYVPRLQRPPRAASGNRDARRVHRRRSLPRSRILTADAAPDGPAGAGARIRRHRHLERTHDRRAAPTYRPSPKCGARIGVPHRRPRPADRARPRASFPIPILSMRSLGKSGRFLPHGSGLGPMTPPPKIDDEQFPTFVGPDSAHVNEEITRAALSSTGTRGHISVHGEVQVRAVVRRETAELA
jgi:hypothetical protein